MTRRPIALTCGDPAGIGPELAESAWAALGGEVAFFWIGDRTHLPGAVPVAEITSPAQADAALCAKALPVIHHPFPAPATPGTPDGRNARAVVEVIERAVGLVLDGAASAVCTAPISKQVLQEGAGFAFPGHTEFLADLAGAERAVMMLACSELRVVPTTIHIPLQDVPAALTAPLLEETLRITHTALVQLFAIAQPRIAVSGLNPHAGEGGRMGREEQELIAPLLERLRGEGMDLRGPLPADTMFHPPARARYDAAVCMYHDQALVPIKTLDFERGVNLTLGLPFIRTSPDHGTAFDIAGCGKANPTSLIEALRLARDLAQSPEAGSLQHGTD